jgi:3-oxoacyl-[acyl-carrier protein] reductase
LAADFKLRYREREKDSMIDTGLAGMVALITGANHGIGAAPARALAHQGCTVFVTDLHLPPVSPTNSAQTGDEDQDYLPGQVHYDRILTQFADEVVRAIEEAGGEADALAADLADLATLPRLFDRAEARFGPVAILVNNADHWHADTLVLLRELGSTTISDGGYPSSTVTATGHDQHFAVNSRATALLIAEYARRQAASGDRWGRILNVSTGSADGFAGAVSYGASKAALESYSRAAARELGTLGITVNVVAPGPIQTGYIPPERERELAAQTPLGRVGRPEDVADATVFLASEQARWLTGQLLVAGGAHKM